MFEAGIFADQPDFRDTDFVAHITATLQYGQRWYYAATEQEAQPAISASGDTSPALLYNDHPTPRVMVLPSTAGGPFLTEINNRQLNTGDLVRVRHKTETPAGTVFECEAGGEAAEPSFVKVGSATLNAAVLPGGRIANCSWTAGSTSLTSSTANFVAGDVGKTLAAPTAFGIPFGTTLASVSSSTTAVLSTAATATASAKPVALGGIQAFGGNLMSWDNASGTFTSGASVWFFEPNGRLPLVNKEYLCWKVGADNGGKDIWGRDIPPSTVYTIGLNSAPSIPATVSVIGGLAQQVSAAGLYLATAKLAAQGQFTGSFASGAPGVAVTLSVNGAEVVGSYGGDFGKAGYFLCPQAGNMFFDSINLMGIVQLNAGDTVQVMAGMRLGNLTGWSTSTFVITETGCTPGCSLALQQIL